MKKGESKRDYYDVLGVSKSADQDTIKKKYRKLAMSYHPDRNPGDAAAEKKFKELNDAYDVLKDKNKRAAYDSHGHAAFQQGGGGGAGFHSGFGEDFADFSDVFSNIFGGGFGTQKSKAQRSSSIRGSDLLYNLTITLEESYYGKKHNINYKAAAVCDHCSGSGSASKSGVTNCLACGGSGVVRAQQGFFTVESTCRTCNGAGSVIKDPCRNCYGQGRVEKEKNIVVSIPAGIEEETKIRVSGEGEAGVKGGSPGDLYIVVAIKKHALFKRRGNDLYCDLPIKFVTAALGGKLEVPCIGGTTALLSIPAGTQSGAQLRLSGKGMPIINTGAYGDLYVKACIETPVHLTAKQRELLEQFESESKSGSSPESEHFFKKVKNLWKAPKP